MKILVFGKNGQVAWELQRSLAVLGEVRTVGSNETSFSSPEAVVKVIRDYKPSHIVNAAAYTAVDKAETEEALANQVNGETVGLIADEAKKISAFFLHYSTDYVFDGSKTSAYVETDRPSPLNAYGRSKLLGEQLIQQVGGASVILRVSWVYGARGSNFYRTMLRLGAEREELKIVSDQIGAPTWCRHIADVSGQIMSSPDVFDKAGLYHLSPQGETSWFGFAKKIFALQAELHPEQPMKVQSFLNIATKDYVTPAQRPLNSRMNSSKLNKTFGLQLPSWDESLKMVMSGQ